MNEKRAAELISENLTAIYGYSFARLYDKDDVDDLSSEIVCEILKSAGRLKDEESFWAFAWKIAENTFRKFIKRKELAAREEELSETTEVIFATPTPEEEYVEDETQSESIYLLRRELSLLSKVHRGVCVAYYVYNRSCSEISKEQKISVEMVKYHLFKTRKLLKEGIGMTRKLGEKSYNPGEFHLNFWGDRNHYDGLFNRRLPGSIVLAAYDVSMTAQELSCELGVAMPYLEEELDTLEAAGILIKSGEKYRTNLVILTEDYERDLLGKTKTLYKEAADSLFDEAKGLLAPARALSFDGNNYDDNRLLWMLLNIASVEGYSKAKKRSPIGKAKALPLGSYGFLFGHDRSYENHHFNGVCMEVWNRAQTAWFSAENYCVIEKCQFFRHNRFDEKIEAMCSAILGEKADERNGTLPSLISGGFISSRDGVLKAEFPVFDSAVYRSLLGITDELSDKIAALMIKVSDIAEGVLGEYVPESVKDQCGDVAKIHHRLDVAAYLVESIVGDGKLTVPDREVPLCVFGVKA